MTIETTATDTTATETVVTTPAVTKTEKPKYLIQREKRQRYSFGNTWLNNVLGGFVTDIDKLIAHGVHVKAGTDAELRALDNETLLKRVQDAIFAEQYVPPTEENETEVDAETEAVETVVEAEKEDEVVAEATETEAA